MTLNGENEHYKVASVASVSPRVCQVGTRTRKRIEGRGGAAWERRKLLFSPPPQPSIFHFFCPRYNFRAITRLETLASQANYKEINITFMVNGGDNHGTILPPIITLADCIFPLSRRSRKCLRQQPKRHVRIFHHITIKPVSIT